MAHRQSRAQILETARPWSVERLTGEQGPSNVGVSLSGGGSRAMVAGMGQLRGLASLRAGGRSVLSRVKALSATSGGAWVAVPYTFLRGSVRDEDFLGPLVAPEELTLRALGELPEGNAGRVAADPGFSPAGLAVEAGALRNRLGVPDHQLWQVLIAAHVLAPAGLFEGWREARGEPASLFSLDAATLQRDVLAENPHLAGVPAHLVADRADPTRARRPFLVCNGAMFVTQPDRLFRPPVPVQMTPLFAGILGRSGGADANGWPVGGGGVTPFAFAGEVRARTGDRVVVEQARPFSLADAVGISCASLAEPIRNAEAHLRDDPSIRASVVSRLEGARAWLPEGVTEAALAAADRFVAELPGDSPLRKLGATDLFVPAYHHVSPFAEPRPDEGRRTSFADGGNIDNTGIAALLAYDDIDTVVAFVNAYEPLEAADLGVLDERGREIPGSRVLLSGQIAPLFGYQSYRPGIGYRLYTADVSPVRPESAHNQVFEPAAFAELLRALWEASGNAEAPGSYLRPAIAKLRLRVLRNDWFGVRGRGGPGDANPEPITLVLVYTTRVRSFHDRLARPVRAVLGDFADPASFGAFPHYPTGRTHLREIDVNLLAHLTAGCVADGPGADLLRGLF